MIILKYLVVLALTIGICLLGYEALEHFYTPKPKLEWDIYDWGIFIILFEVIIQPMCDYWWNLISKLFGFKS